MRWTTRFPLRLAAAVAVAMTLSSCATSQQKQSDRVEPDRAAVTACRVGRWAQEIVEGPYARVGELRSSYQAVLIAVDDSTVIPSDLHAELKSTPDDFQSLVAAIGSLRDWCTGQSIPWGG